MRLAGEATCARTACLRSPDSDKRDTRRTTPEDGRGESLCEKRGVVSANSRQSSPGTGWRRGTTKTHSPLMELLLGIRCSKDKRPLAWVHNPARTDVAEPKHQSLSNKTELLISIWNRRDWSMLNRTEALPQTPGWMLAGLDRGEEEDQPAEPPGQHGKQAEPHTFGHRGALTVGTFRWSSIYAGEKFSSTITSLSVAR